MLDRRIHGLRASEPPGESCSRPGAAIRGLAIRAFLVVRPAHRLSRLFWRASSKQRPSAFAVAFLAPARSIRAWRCMSAPSDCDEAKRKRQTEEHAPFGKGDIG